MSVILLYMFTLIIISQFEFDLSRVSFGQKYAKQEVFEMRKNSNFYNTYITILLKYIIYTRKNLNES